MQIAIHLEDIFRRRYKLSVSDCDEYEPHDCRLCKGGKAKPRKNAKLVSIRIAQAWLPIVGTAPVLFACEH